MHAHVRFAVGVVSIALLVFFAFLVNVGIATYLVQGAWQTMFVGALSGLGFGLLCLGLFSAKLKTIAGDEEWQNTQRVQARAFLLFLSVAAFFVAFVRAVSSAPDALVYKQTNGSFGVITEYPTFVWQYPDMEDYDTVTFKELIAIVEASSENDPKTRISVEFSARGHVGVIDEVRRFAEEQNTVHLQPLIDTAVGTALKEAVKARLAMMSVADAENCRSRGRVCEIEINHAETFGSGWIMISRVVIRDVGITTVF